MTAARDDFGRSSGRTASVEGAARHAAPVSAPAAHPAAIAHAAFCRRREAARRHIAQSRTDADTAGRHLAPWAALAISLGADLPELADDLADATTIHGPPFERALLRRIVADDLCPRAERLDILARAAARAIQRRTAEADDLAALCCHFNLMPRFPTEEPGRHAA